MTVSPGTKGLLIPQTNNTVHFISDNDYLQKFPRVDQLRLFKVIIRK